MVGADTHGLLPVGRIAHFGRKKKSCKRIMKEIIKQGLSKKDLALMGDIGIEPMTSTV
jgi:hypothetical protein